MAVDTRYDYLPFNWSTSGGLIPIGGYSWTSARVRLWRPRDFRVRGRSLAVKMTYWLSR